MPPLDPSTSDLQNPGKSTPKVQARAPNRSHDLSNDLRPSPSNLCKSAHNFRKLTISWSSKALDWQNQKKKFRDQKSCHAPLMTSVFVASANTHSHAPPLSLMRLHVPGISPRTTRHTCVLWHHGWRLYDITTHYGLAHLSSWPGLTRTDPEI